MGDTKPTLFSYVVARDTGFAPNPSDGVCTLAKCKFRKDGSKRKNIVELAKKGDWVVGTGGLGKQSAGHGKLIYAMRVDEKMTLKEYFEDERFRGRIDNTLAGSNRTDRYALISQHFFYFGKKAVRIPRRYLTHPLEKKGRGFRRFRSKSSAAFIKNFVEWLERKHKVGVHGEPCAPRDKLRPQIRKKNCSGC